MSLRRGLVFGAVLVTAATVASVALAVAPRGNANYISVDAKGRPAITLWMQTAHRMWVFACYSWGPGAHHGDHYNNSNPITVNSQGWFSYHGPARSMRGTATLTLRGHFVTRDEAVATITVSCFKHHTFTARYSAH